MIAYTLRRLLMLPLVILGVSLLIFALLSFLSPYKRLSLYVDENVMSHLNSQEDWDALVHRYGLDRPIQVQYWNWIKGVFRGDLGYSRSAQMPVSDALAKYFPASVELTLLAVIPVVLFAVRMGFFSASHPNTLADHATRWLAITGWSLPTFVAGLLFLLIFYGFVPWFPPGRMSPGLSACSAIRALLTTPTSSWWTRWRTAASTCSSTGCGTSCCRSSRSPTSLGR